MNLTVDQMEKRPDEDIRDVETRITRRRVDNSLDVEFIGKDVDFYSRVRVVLGSRDHPKESKPKSHLGQRVWNLLEPNNINSAANISTKNLETRIVAHDDYSVEVRFFDNRDQDKEYRHVRVMLGSPQVEHPEQETSSPKGSFDKSQTLSHKVSVKDRKKLKKMYHL